MTENEFVRHVMIKVAEQAIPDSLADPWDQEHTGDQYSSIAHDVRRIIELTIEEYKKSHE